MDEKLRKLIAGFLSDALHEINALLAGRITADQWQATMARDILVHHTAAYMTGRGIKELTKEGRRVVLAEVAKQVDYLNGFADAYLKGGKSEAYWRARAKMYAGSLKSTFSRGRWSYWSLPFHPGDGSSECGGACGCVWDSTILDEENLDADFTWRLGGAEHHCKTCPQRAAASPYRFRGGKLR